MRVKAEDGEEVKDAGGEASGASMWPAGETGPPAALHG